MENEITGVVAESSQRFAFDSLDSVRKRLLDLTARNKLLNYKYSQSSSLRIVDELPDQLFHALSNDSSLLIASVPEPTRHELIEAGYITIDPETKQERRLPHPSATIWAQHLGFNTSYDLPEPRQIPDSRHTDNKIQTLLYANELEAVLRNLYTKSKTAIEETGANILYLALGFLDWFDNTDSNQMRSAPLITIPVNLEKGKLENGIFLYSISYTGEDLLGNLCLQKKLAEDFNIALPDLEEDDTPEGYFGRVRDVLSVNQPNWGIKRQAGLVLLDFTKLLMYLDLDPTRWPSNKGILEHPLIKQFFESCGESSSDAAESQFHIDSSPDIHFQAPLVLDADSSQHEAIFDVIHGKSMVILGPPGTGKSQTITNIIAAALGKRKSILFVAEKMAALDVVKSRLESVGLGEFCLELHSHKSQKRKILSDIQSRLSMRIPSYDQSAFDAHIKHFESLKDRLTAYVQAVNSPWKYTGLTIHQILMKAARCSEKKEFSNLRNSIDFTLFGDFNQQSLLDYQNNLEHFLHAFEEVKRQVEYQKLTSHPWFGVQKYSLTPVETDQLSLSLVSWLDESTKLMYSIELLSKTVGVELETSESHARYLASQYSLAKQYVESVQFHLLPIMLKQDLSGLLLVLEVYKDIHELKVKLTATFQNDYLADPKQMQMIVSSAEKLQRLTDINHKISNIYQITKFLDELNQEITNTIPLKNEVIEALKNGATSKVVEVIDMCLGDSYSGIRGWIELIDLANMLPQRLLSRRSSIFDDERLDYHLSDFVNKLAVFRSGFSEASQFLNLPKLPSLIEIEEILEQISNDSLFNWFSSDWRHARSKALSFAKNKKSQLHVIKENLAQYVDLSSSFSTFEKNHEAIPILGAFYIGLETDGNDLLLLRSWYQAVREKYGQGFGKKVVFGDLLLELNSSTIKGIQSLYDKGFSAELASQLSKYSSIAKALNRLSDFNNLGASLSGSEGLLLKTRNLILQVLGGIQPGLKHTDIELKELILSSDSLQKLEVKTYSFLDNKWVGILAKHEVALSIDLDAYDESIFNSLRCTALFSQKISNMYAPLVDSMHSCPTPIQWHAIVSNLQNIDENWRSYENKASVFSQLGNVRIDQWLSTTEGKLSSIINRHRVALDNPQWIYTWCDYLKIKNRMGAAGALTLLNQIEDGLLAPELAVLQLEYEIFRFLASNILNDHILLGEFSGLDQNAIRTKFQQIDIQLQKLQQERLRSIVSIHNAPIGISGGRVADYTELSLIKRELEKKTRHIPIRQLIKRAGKALQEIKPCFMMGPMSVAQYLQAGDIQFDIVIMDEASQIKPEDALGTVARGKQVIIVGDPKQLPPTSFFDKISQEEDSQDISVLQDSESILEAASSLLKTRSLNWHYRSQHESLIAFSNQAFYQSDLVVFPSPFADSPEYGVKFTHVRQGKFVNRRNLAEAEAIAHATKLHLMTRPNESLGIVAMNAEQGEHIERAIESLAKEDSAFQKVLEQNANLREHMFVKNLENVQGDERDVIMISFTYGPMEVGGKVPQRFGPINSAGGWRRLNVLFSRAKKRMHAFSSMLASDILVSESSNISLRSLRNFLAFAESGVLYQPEINEQANFDSDFEKSVAEKLANHGFECVSQVGVAGYFIDLAVRDPRQRGRLLLAIECDGAAYHSGKTARDRDRLRQQVLEGLGWKVCRIWSTDWFKNPNAEIAKILHELEKLMEQIAVSEPEEKSYLPEISEVVELTQEVIDEVVPAVSEKPLKLVDILSNYQKDVLDSYNRQVDREKLLLSNAMILSLDQHRPTTVSEFQQLIPKYIREMVAASEGIYLKHVLKLIENYEDNIFRDQHVSEM